MKQLHSILASTGHSRTSFIAAIAGFFLFVLVQGVFAQEAPKTTPLNEFKEITDASKNAFTAGQVKEIKIQPKPDDFFTTINKEWIYMLAPGKVEYHRPLILVLPQADRKPPVFSLTNEGLKSVAEKLNKWDYELVRLYVMQRSIDSAVPTDTIVATRDNIMVCTYRGSNGKRSQTLPLAGLGIKSRPALFFSYGKDEGGNYIKVLVVDEDSVAVLHRPDTKGAVIKYYPDAMKVSAYGAVNYPEKAMEIITRK